MAGDQSMSDIKAEYEMLFNAFKASYEQEKRLVKRSKELSEQTLQNKSVDELKKDIHTFWKRVEKYKNDEENARKTIASMKTEIAQLYEALGIEPTKPHEASSSDPSTPKEEGNNASSTSKYILYTGLLAVTGFVAYQLFNRD